MVFMFPEKEKCKSAIVWVSDEGGKIAQSKLFIYIAAFGLVAFVNMLKRVDKSIWYNILETSKTIMNRILLVDDRVTSFIIQN